MSREQRYGPIRTAWVAMYRPVQAVRRAEHLGLAAAWGVHLAGMVALGLTVMAIAVWDFNGGRLDPSGLEERGRQVAEVAWVSVGDPRLWVGLIGLGVGAELFWLMSAAVVMSWCAREEPYRESYRRALRRLWLLTPHLAPAALVLGGVFVGLHNSERWRLGVFGRMNTEGVFLWMMVCLPVCVWLLRVVLEALRVNPPGAASRWPLRCEGCGYEVVGLDPAGSCPECGKAISETMDPKSRPGIEAGGGLGWYLRQTYSAMRRPSAFGRRIQVMSADEGFRRCLTMTLLLQLALMPIAWLGLTTLVGTIEDTSWRFMRHVAMTAMILSITLCLMMMAATAGVCMLIAGIAGVTEGRHLKRNLMPAAARAVGYLSGFAVLWSVVVWCNVGLTVVVLEYDLLPMLAAQTNIAGDKLLVYWNYGGLLIGVLIFGVLVERVTKAARYANW